MPIRINFCGKDKLENLYWNDDFTVREIANKFNVCSSTVVYRMKNFGRHGREILNIWYKKKGWGKRHKHDDYMKLKKPSHHRADSKGWVWEHIYIWEEYNKKRLPENWIIHHINGIRDDNRIENLLFPLNLLSSFDKHEPKSKFYVLL